MQSISQMLKIHVGMESHRYEPCAQEGLLLTVDLLLGRELLQYRGNAKMFLKGFWETRIYSIFAHVW